MRPSYYSKRIESLIKEEFDKLLPSLDEIFDSETNTKYEILNKYLSGFFVTTYRFSTNSNTSYDLEFFHDVLNGRTRLDNKTEIGNHLKIKYVETCDIGFTLTSTIINHNDDVEDDVYNQNTNKNEGIELFSRISFLIKEFIKNNPKIKIFVVGRNTHSIKLKSYRLMYSNIFKNEFTLFEGESVGYSEGALYFIKNSILK